METINYRRLRYFIGLCGLMLVSLLKLSSSGADVSSISNYYFVDGLTRDLFVGLLVAMGTFFVCYKGYDFRDTIISLIAGLSIWTVALVPSGSIVHDIAALIFFSCTAVFSLYLFRLGNSKVKNNLFLVCGLGIIISLLGMPFWGMYIGESIAILFFSTSWITKSI